MINLNDNIVGIDSAIFMHPSVWKASGHVDAFNDPLIDNKDSKKRYRADILIESYIQKIEKLRMRNFGMGKGHKLEKKFQNILINIKNSSNNNC